MTLSEQIIEYFAANPNCIFIDRDSCKGRPRYRARIIFRGVPEFLEYLVLSYGKVKGETKKEQEDNQRKRWKGKKEIRFSDGECSLILSAFAEELAYNTRAILCRRLLDAKRIGRGGAGRGVKTTLDHEEIYQEYLKLK